MRQSLLFCTICCICVLGSANRAVAGSNKYFQPTPKDSIPSRIIPKVGITVRDLAGGHTIDSVMVTLGNKKGYTNTAGYVEFDSVTKESLVITSKNGYLVSSKKVKPALTVRIEKKESSSIAQYNNGLYNRPIEHFSGAYTVVPGAELRKINSLNFIEALKVFAPSLIVTKNNNYGDEPNFPPSINIRGAYNFPASATIASHQGTTNATVQLNPSAGDFVADNIADPNQAVILLDGVQVALQTVLDMDM